MVLVLFEVTNQTVPYYYYSLIQKPTLITVQSTPYFPWPILLTTAQHKNNNPILPVLIIKTVKALTSTPKHTPVNLFPSPCLQKPETPNIPSFAKLLHSTPTSNFPPLNYKPCPCPQVIRPPTC